MGSNIARFQASFVLALLALTQLVVGGLSEFVDAPELIKRHPGISLNDVGTAANGLKDKGKDKVTEKAKGEVQKKVGSMVFGRFIGMIIGVIIGLVVLVIVGIAMWHFCCKKEKEEDLEQEKD